MHYFIEPEVAGGWGNHTVADTSVHPPDVKKLHYHFDGWLGDELLETFPCFIVTASLKDDLISSGLSGFEFDDVEVSKSDEFFSEEGYSVLPIFFWLKINEIGCVNDFGIATDHRLLISDKALNVLRNHRISHAEISPV